MAIANLEATNWRRPATNPAALAVGIGIPPRPDDLSEQACYWWDYYAPMLADKKLLSPADAALFREFCELCGEIQKLKADIAKNGGYCVDSKGDEKARPQTKQLFSCRGQLISMCRRFGLSPADRSNMRTMGDQTPTEDPLLKMFEARQRRN